MTSKERHEARYRRRKRKREEKHERLYGKYDDFNRVCGLDALYRAYRQSKKGVGWKASTQRYTMHLLPNLNQLHNDLLDGKDIRKGFIKFDLMERGKIRHISSVHFSERIVQRSLCDEALIPMFSRYLIYDNGASLKNKGIDFALRRCKAFLQKHYRKYGTEGYALSIDFSSYFENINHEYLYSLIDKDFKDARLNALIKSFISAFGSCGLGLGSQVSQISAIAFPNMIDHYIKEKLRVKYYVRYMDDSLFILPSKAEAQRVLSALLPLYEAVGIKVNMRKTKITKISHGFIFLKTQFYLLPGGVVLQKICRKSTVRMRRKLKKLHKMEREGKIEFGGIRNAYQSWVGYAKRKNTYTTRKHMNELFHMLFIYDWLNRQSEITYACADQRRKQNDRERAGAPRIRDSRVQATA